MCADTLVNILPFRYGLLSRSRWLDYYLGFSLVYRLPCIYLTHKRFVFQSRQDDGVDPRNPRWSGVFAQGLRLTSMIGIHNKCPTQRDDVSGESVRFMVSLNGYSMIFLFHKLTPLSPILLFFYICYENNYFSIVHVHLIVSYLYLLVYTTKFSVNCVIGLQKIIVY